PTACSARWRRSPPSSSARRSPAAQAWRTRAARWRRSRAGPCQTREPTEQPWCDLTHLGYRDRARSIPRDRATPLGRTNAVNAPQEVQDLGPAPRRWAGRAARVAGGLALVAGLGVAGAGAASAVEVNPWSAPAPVPVAKKVEVNPWKATAPSLDKR